MIDREQAVRHAEGAWRTASRRDREAHQDGKIHASALHECPRQVQLRYRGTAPTDPVVDKLGIRPQEGTAIHDRFLPLWAEEWRADAEVDNVLIDDRHRSTEVEMGPLTAHPDLVVFFTDGTVAIGELKTTHKAVVQAAQNQHFKRAHLDQCRVGGLLTEHRTGAPMRGYWIYYLDIADPERYWEMATFPWTEDEVDAAHAACSRGLALAGESLAPRWFGKHDTDAFAPYSPCRSCEFQSGCLGKDAADPLRREAAAELVDAGARFGEEVRAAQDDLVEFLRRKELVERPKRHKSHVTEVVEHLGLQPGPYQVGSGVRELEWRKGYSKDDGAAAARMLRDLGKDVPQTWVEGHFRFT